MGGKALNKYGVYTVRKTTEEFNQIAFDIQNRISNDFNHSVETFVTPCYKSKSTHGDLDLLFKINEDSNINLREYIKNAFKPKAIYSNGGVQSFDYDNFQIDIIPIMSDNWEVAKTYFSNDPLPNIQGKVYHKFGLSYGWDGLSYKFRNFSGRLSQKIIISKDSRKIFDFASYDYDKYLEGFNTLEDIFKYAINNKYFDVEVFQFHNLNHIDRKRNLRRDSYNKFINYLSDKNINTRYNYKEKDDYIIDIDNFFPEANLLNKINALKELDSKNKIISQKFNGDIVMSWVDGLMGKELGRLMNKFRESLGDDYDDFILNSSYDMIRNEFFKVYNNE